MSISVLTFYVSKGKKKGIACCRRLIDKWYLYKRPSDLGIESLAKAKRPRRSRTFGKIDFHLETRLKLYPPYVSSCQWRYRSSKMTIYIVAHVPYGESFINNTSSTCCPFIPLIVAHMVRKPQQSVIANWDIFLYSTLQPHLRSGSEHLRVPQVDHWSA